jgi:hypothetical protein
MPTRKTRPTEADMEAHISKVLQHAFPTLSTVNIRHQLSFQIRLGRRKYDIKSGVRDWAKGRCDILLTKDDRPLAIVELKRPDIALTKDDGSQGLSYARLMDPWPPLVIVSNGKDTLFFETFSGREWQPTSLDEAALATLMKTSASLAETDLKHAVDTLLGANEKCWTSIAREFTEHQISGLTGSLGDLLSPFPLNLILPRKATAALTHCLKTTASIPFIVGPPLSGKSNVLREFIRNSVQSRDFAALYLDADSSSYGVFQTIANLMSQSLGWGFDTNQARTWLHRLSWLEGQPEFVILIDGGCASLLKMDIDELASGTYGPNLRLVVSAEQSEAMLLLKSTTGRQRTALGTKAMLINVGPLDDEEFNLAESTLYEARFSFMHGSLHAADHRKPWLLRCFLASFADDPKFEDQSLAAVIPSVPGMQALSYAEDRFGQDVALKGQHLKIAEAMLIDVDLDSPSIDFSLLRATSCVCLLETLGQVLSDCEIATLVSKGYLKHHIVGNDRIVVAQLPAFVLSCASQLLASQIANPQTSDARAAADRLITVCSRLPFGEVLGAQAIYRSSFLGKRLPYGLIERLLERDPMRRPFPPGTRVATIWNGRRIDIEIMDERRSVASFPDGERHEIVSDGAERYDSMADTFAFGDRSNGCS